MTIGLERTFPRPLVNMRWPKRETYREVSSSVLIQVRTGYEKRIKRDALATGLMKADHMLVQPPVSPPNAKAKTMMPGNA